MQHIPFSFQGQTLWLNGHRYLFWDEAKALVLSDLHIGKTGHFRKAGLAMPTGVAQNDLQRLFAAIQFYKPQELIIVGDLFHSSHNTELDHFVRWREGFPHVKFTLVEGNHDILKQPFYQNAAIEVVKGVHHHGAFSFSHDLPRQNGQHPLPYCITGHLHPGISLHGLARQSMTLPCFYFGKQHAVLPAFGAFTGLAKVRPSAGDKLFAVVENKVVALGNRTTIQ